MKCLGVYDHPHWILCQLAEAYKAHNPEVDYCLMGRVEFEWMLSQVEPKNVLQSYDLIHFFCPWAAQRNAEKVHSILPVVSAVYHIVDNSSIDYVKHSDSVLFMSKRWLEKVDPVILPVEKRKWRPIGVDTELFYPPNSYEDRLELRKRLKLPCENEILIGYCANRDSDFKGRKGFDLYLKSIRKLSSTYSNVRFLLIGKGWDEDVRKLKSIGIDLFYVPFEDDIHTYAEWIRCLDIFWVTSSIEGGPMPAFEALASGVFLVSTNVGMIPDHLLDPPVCSLLKRSSVECLIGETEVLLKNLVREPLLNSSGVERVKERLSLSKCSTGIKQVYEEAISSYKKMNKDYDVERASSERLPPRVRKEGKALMECEYIRTSIRFGYVPHNWIATSLQLAKYSSNPIFLRKLLGLLKDRVKLGFRGR